MQPYLADSPTHRARFVWLAALLVAGVMTFLATRPPAEPEWGMQTVGRCRGR